VDWLYQALEIQASAVVGQASELIPYPVQLISALILTLLILYNTVSRIKQGARHAHSH